MCELDVGAGWKYWMRSECRPQPIESIEIRQWTKHDALRVADFEERGRHGFANHRDAGLTQICRLPHPRSKCVALAFTCQQMERLGTRVGFNRHCRPWSKILSPRDESREASQAVPRQLRPAAVGVEELHRRAAIVKRVEQQPIGTDAVMAVADGARQ
jgi:hypothetical protein